MTDGSYHESAKLSQKDLSSLQDRPAKGRYSGDLQEQTSQTAAGLVGPGGELDGRERRMIGGTYRRR